MRLSLCEVYELEYFNDCFSYIYNVIGIIYMMNKLILYRVTFDLFGYKCHYVIVNPLYV